MKKFLAFMMTFVMMLGIVGGVSATEAHAAEHKHCICGGKAAGIGDHKSCSDETWIELTDTLASSTLTSGNYYLGADLTLTGRLGAAQDAIVNICLNGYKLNGTTDPSHGTIFVQNAGAIVSVCDCKETGVVVGTSAREGSCLYIIGDTITVNLYSGTFQYQGGPVNKSGTAVSLNKGLLNIYNAVITGGNSTTMGGNLYVKRGVVNMYGGKIIDGVAATNGGNVLIKNQGDDTKSVFNLYNGIITGGTLTNDEGGAGKSDIYVLDTLNVYNAQESLYIKFASEVADKADFSKMNSSLSGVPTTAEGLQANFLLTKDKTVDDSQTSNNTPSTDDTVKDDTVKDDTVKDDTVKDDTVKDDTVKDGAVADNTVDPVIIVVCVVIGIAVVAGVVYFMSKKRKA